MSVAATVAFLGIGYATHRMLILMMTLSTVDWGGILWGGGATFLRVELALVLAGLWAIPAGVFVGLQPRWSAVAQPIAQVAALLPASATSTCYTAPNIPEV